MTVFVALLRAINVGGRKLLMSDLHGIAAGLGFERARTYIASGNLLLSTGLEESQVKPMLEARLAEHMGAAVPVIVRTGAELERVVANNPFTSDPGNRVVAIFLDSPPPTDAVENARNIADERIALGNREVYVAYSQNGMAGSRLRIPGAEAGTARNMNTVARLAGLAKEMA